MFCERCGAPWPENARFCSTCGMAGSPKYVPAGQNRVNQHVRLLAIIWLALGAVRLAAAGAVFFVGHYIFRMIELPMVPARILPGVMSLVGSFLLFKAILALMAGYGLWERQPWGRMLALVLGFISLLFPPVGTIVGIYTLWVLLPEQSEREYAAMSRAAQAN